MNTKTQMESSPRSLHTPAPWLVIGDMEHPANARITSAKRPHIAKVYASTLKPDRTCKANARLIAAAPELLEELKEMVRAYSNIPDRIIGCSLAHRCDKARAAIAKAEGALSDPEQAKSKTDSGFSKPLSEGA